MISVLVFGVICVCNCLGVNLKLVLVVLILIGCVLFNVIRGL